MIVPRVHVYQIFLLIFPSLRSSPQFRIYKSTISFKKSKGGLFPRLLTPYELDMADDTKVRNVIRLF